MVSENRHTARKKLGYYMPLIDHQTQERIGYLSDISLDGFKLDCQKSLKINQEYSLRLELTPEISERPYIVFIARVMWSKPDPINPNEFIQGFKLVRISIADQKIYQLILEKYGKSESKWSF